MYEDAFASVDVSVKCCNYFIDTLNGGCYFYVLVKQFESMHLCDDNLGAGRGQTIWDTSAMASTYYRLFDYIFYSDSTGLINSIFFNF